MNNVCLIGRLVADPELRYTNDKKAYVRVNIAVDRGLSKEDKEAGKQNADFISCVFWNSTAEVLGKYAKKGHQVGIQGSIRTGSYEKDDGTKGYTTDVLVRNLKLLENKKVDSRPEPEYPYEDSNDDSFPNEIVLSDDDLPF